jgi:cyclophilin family peptidyl-prolyl cis-trans isomerase
MDPSLMSSVKQDAQKFQTNQVCDNPCSYLQHVFTYPLQTAPLCFSIDHYFFDHNIVSIHIGTFSMANTGSPNSGGSQFFINTGTIIKLNLKYSIKFYFMYSSNIVYVIYSIFIFMCMCIYVCINAYIL